MERRSAEVPGGYPQRTARRRGPRSFATCDAQRDHLRYSLGILRMQYGVDKGIYFWDDVLLNEVQYASPQSGSCWPSTKKYCRAVLFYAKFALCSRLIASPQALTLLI